MLMLFVVSVSVTLMYETEASSRLCPGGQLMSDGRGLRVSDAVTGHVIDAAARVADVLLRWCPGVRILATSREPLRSPCETVWRVPSLGLPPPAGVGATLEDMMGFESARLFIDRAQAALPRLQHYPSELRRRPGDLPPGWNSARNRARRGRGCASLASGRSLLAFCYSDGIRIQQIR